MKMRIGTIAAIIIICAPIVAWSQTTVWSGRKWTVSTSTITDHGNAATVGSLAYVLAAIGSDPAEIVFPADKTYTVTTALTIPATVALRFESGAVLEGSVLGTTLTWTAPGAFIDSPRQQIFATSLAHAGAPNRGELLPEWFGILPGNDGTVNLAGWNDLKAGCEVHGGCVLSWAGGTFDFDSFTWDSLYPIRASGPQAPFGRTATVGQIENPYSGTVIRHAADDTGILFSVIGTADTQTGRVTFENMTFIGNANTDEVVYIDSVNRGLVLREINVITHEAATTADDDDCLGLEIKNSYFVETDQVDVFRWVDRTSVNTGNLAIDNIDCHAVNGTPCTATFDAIGDKTREPSIGSRFLVMDMQGSIAHNNIWTATAVDLVAETVTWDSSENATAWATTTWYNYGMLATNGGVVYECLVTHYSGTFATDLSGGKWQILADDATTEGRATWMDGYGVGLKVWNETGDALYQGGLNQSMFRQMRVLGYDRCIQVGADADTGPANVSGIILEGGSTEFCLSSAIFVGEGVENIGINGLHMEHADKCLDIHHGAAGVALRDSRHGRCNHGVWLDGTSGANDVTLDNVGFRQAMFGVSVEAGAGSDGLRMRNVRFDTTEDGVGVGIRVLKVSGNPRSDILMDNVRFDAQGNAFAIDVDDPTNIVRVPDTRSFADSLDVVSATLDLQPSYSGALLTNVGAALAVQFNLPNADERANAPNRDMHYRFLDNNATYALRIKPESGDSICNLVGSDGDVTDPGDSPADADALRDDLVANTLPSIEAISGGWTLVGDGTVYAKSGTTGLGYLELRALDDDTWIVTSQWGVWTQGP